MFQLKSSKKHRNRERERERERERGRKREKKEKPDSSFFLSLSPAVKTEKIEQQPSSKQNNQILIQLNFRS